MNRSGHSSKAVKNWSKRQLGFRACNLTLFAVQVVWVVYLLGGAF